MAATEFNDRTAVSHMKQQLLKSVADAYALAWAIARFEGHSEGAEGARAARDAMLNALPTTTRNDDFNGGDFHRAEGKGAEGAEIPASAQEMLLIILKGGDASVRELQDALDDHGITVSPGNLSVILSRMNQAGLIQRTGRGIYRYAR